MERARHITIIDSISIRTMNLYDDLYEMVDRADIGSGIFSPRVDLRCASRQTGGEVPRYHLNRLYSRERGGALHLLRS